MRIDYLVGCEESQAVTIELRKLGIMAYSCDMLECSGGHPEWHIQGDVLKVIEEHPEIRVGIFFPPCTHLAVSGARHFEQKRKDGRQQEGIDFFMALTRTNIKHTAIENPVGIMSTIYRKPDQVIQPYYFGDRERKTTCLWLKGLPALYHNRTKDLFCQTVSHVGVDYYETSTGEKYTNIHNGMGYGWNTPECKKARSKTFPGIAKAMAAQWSNL